MSSLPLDTGVAVLREWVPADRDALVAEADDRAVWRNLMSTFPNPYTPRDADEWIARCRRQRPPRDLVIDRAGRLVGVCGVDLGEGVGRYTGSVGYWLGRRHWNQGVATSVLASFLEYVWDTFDVRRLEAEVFSWNPASARVLEKNGFHLEGTRRRAIFKDGELIDGWIYTLFRPDAKQR